MPLERITERFKDIVLFFTWERLSASCIFGIPELYSFPEVRSIYTADYFINGIAATGELPLVSVLVCVCLAVGV